MPGDVSMVPLSSLDACEQSSVPGGNQFPIALIALHNQVARK